VHAQIRIAAAIATLATLLAGCATGWNGALDNTRPAEPTLAARNAHAATRPDTSRSRMLANAVSSELLYVSDVGVNDVYVYTYPARTLVGTLTGFKEPQGMCTDRQGDVWIANTQKSQLVEYVHGGTQPIATLADPNAYPVGCAVDAHGNLAATNIVTANGGAGNVAWYAHAAGKPAIIASPSFAEVYFAGFDASGNLFVDGWPPNFAQAAFGVVRHGSQTLETLTVKGATIAYPGGVQFHGNTVNVGDQINNVVFQIAEDGTVVGDTPLDGAANCVQGTIVARIFICPDSVNAAVEFFRYPSGGGPTRVMRAFTEPTGSTISK
jgi:hypothetical protein